MILTSLQDTQSIDVVTSAGREKGVSYLGQTFVPGNSYKDINAAIAACKRDLDNGLATLVVPEADLYRVWYSVPREMLSLAA